MDEQLARMKLNEARVQICPQCGSTIIGVLAGGKETICKNCGFKDPCCE